MDDPEQSGSVTGWLNQARQGDQEAISGLWTRYFEQLVSAARNDLGGAKRIASDEEDIALQAIDTFCRNLAGGKLAEVQDRIELWKLLLAITKHKAASELRNESSSKRGAGLVFRFSELPEQTLEEASSLVEDTPKPEMLVSIRDLCEVLESLLPDDTTRNVAKWKLEGYTSYEISQKMNLCVRTVERKIRLIRKEWGRYYDNNFEGQNPT